MCNSDYVYLPALRLDTTKCLPRERVLLTILEVRDILPTVLMKSRDDDDELMRSDYATYHHPDQSIY